MASVGALGPIAFEVSADHVLTWTSMSRERSVTLVEHEVLDDKPRLQVTGLSLETVELEIKLAYPWCNPAKELEQLRALQDDGAHHELVLGGQRMGAFVVERVRESRRYTDKSGRPLSLNVSLSLKEYN